MKKRKLFIASSSPRRIEILTQFKIKNIQIKNLLSPEPKLNTKNPLKKQIRKLCLLKATTSQSNYHGLILSSDTVVVLNKKILGKPKDIKESIETLSLLSNKTHKVISGIAIVDTQTNKVITRTETTYINFNSINKNEITKYCKQYKPLDKAGSYGIQEVPSHFVKEINGCYFNVMGLPIKTLLKVLKNYDIV